VNAKSFLYPVISGGLIIGVLSGLPVVSVCCCLWIVSGGAIAAYLLQANCEEPITIGDGVLAGLLAGVLGAVVQLVVSAGIRLLRGADIQAELSEVDQLPNMPPEIVDLIDRINSSGFAGILLIGVSFILMLVFGAMFSSLGGLIGAFFFKKRAAAVPPPPPFAAGPGPDFPGAQ
jgi:hypothetical protein